MKWRLTAFGIEVYNEMGKRGMTLRDLSKELGGDYGFLWTALHGQGTSAPLENKVKKYFRWE